MDGKLSTISTRDFVRLSRRYTERPTLKKHNQLFDRNHTWPPMKAIQISLNTTCRAKPILLISVLAPARFADW